MARIVPHFLRKRLLFFHFNERIFLKLYDLTINIFIVLVNDSLSCLAIQPYAVFTQIYILLY